MEHEHEHDYFEDGFNAYMEDQPESAMPSGLSAADQEDWLTGYRPPGMCEDPADRYTNMSGEEIGPEDEAAGPSPSEERIVTAEEKAEAFDELVEREGDDLADAVEGPAPRRRS